MGDIKIKDRAALGQAEFTGFPEAGRCKENNPDSSACNTYIQTVKKWWGDNQATLSTYVEGDINTVQACIKPTPETLGGKVRPWNDVVLNKLKDSLSGCKTALLAVQDDPQHQEPIHTPPIVDIAPYVAPTLEPVPDITVGTLRDLFWGEMVNLRGAAAAGDVVVVGIQYEEAVKNLQKYVADQFAVVGMFSEVSSAAGGRSAAELARELNALPPTGEGWIAEARKRVKTWDDSNWHNAPELKSNIDAVSTSADQNFQWYYENLISTVAQKRVDAGQDKKNVEQDAKFTAQDKKNAEQDAQLGVIEKKKEERPTYFTLAGEGGEINDEPYYLGFLGTAGDVEIIKEFLKLKWQARLLIADFQPDAAVKESSLGIYEDPQFSGIVTDKLSLGLQFILQLQDHDKLPTATIDVLGGELDPRYRLSNNDHGEDVDFPYPLTNGLGAQAKFNYAWKTIKRKAMKETEEDVVAHGIKGSLMLYKPGKFKWTGYKDNPIEDFKKDGTATVAGDLGLYFSPANWITIMPQLLFMKGVGDNTEDTYMVAPSLVTDMYFDGKWHVMLDAYYAALNNDNSEFGTSLKAIWQLHQKFALISELAMRQSTVPVPSKAIVDGDIQNSWEAEEIKSVDGLDKGVDRYSWWFGGKLNMTDDASLGVHCGVASTNGEVDPQCKVQVEVPF